jgi:hypothetical protein
MFAFLAFLALMMIPTVSAVNGWTYETTASTCAGTWSDPCGIVSILMLFLYFAHSFFLIVSPSLIGTKLVDLSNVVVQVNHLSIFPMFKLATGPFLLIMQLMVAAQ